MSQGARASALLPKVSSVLPTIEEFLESPAKTARDWLNSSRRKRFVPFWQSELKAEFNTLMDYVKRLQGMNDNESNPDFAESLSKNMNRILEGGHGVGKTGIVKTVCRFIDEMRERYGQDFRVVSFYCNCVTVSDLRQLRARLAELLDRYIPDFSATSYETLGEIVRAAFEHDIRLFLVFDDLQCKHAPLDEDYYGYHAFISDLSELGRECGHVATVITGSSARAKRYAFHLED